MNIIKKNKNYTVNKSYMVNKNNITKPNKMEGCYKTLEKE